MKLQLAEFSVIERPQGTDVSADLDKSVLSLSRGAQDRCVQRELTTRHFDRRRKYSRRRRKAARISITGISEKWLKGTVVNCTKVELGG